MGVIVSLFIILLVASVAVTVFFVLKHKSATARAITALAAVGGGAPSPVNGGAGGTPWVKV